MPRIAIIGAAHPHVEYVLDELSRPERAGFELVGVQDPDPERAGRYAEARGARAYERVDELLATAPDAVMIAGVYGARGDDIVAALRAGSHVIADKPMCTTLDALSRIEDAAASSGRAVSLLLEKRGYPETLAALRVVSSGELGEIVGITSSGPHKLNRHSRPDWFFRSETYGGILADLAVHDLDAALLFAPAESGIVRGWTSAIDQEGFARYGSASLITAQTVVNAEVSWLTPQASDVHGDYRMRLVGTRGTAEIFWARGRVEVTTGETPTRELELPPGRRPAQDVFDALAAGTLSAVDTGQAVAATRLALLAQDSAARGGEPRPWSSSDGRPTSTRQETT